MSFCIALARLAAPVAAMVALAAPLGAQATRVWVSGVGDDANPCSRTAPCKTFAGAMLKVARGGEISALDPGGFGAVTITKSVTIDGTGTLGSILGSGTSGININITDPADSARSVRIRGLTINGAGTGTRGINVVAARRVTIVNSVIDGFADGIAVTGSDDVRVFVAGTTVSNNRGVGITVSARGGQVAISDVSVVLNDTGLAAAAGGSIVSFGNNAVFGNRVDGAPTGSRPLR